MTDNSGKIVATARVAKTLPEMKISFFDGKVNVKPFDPSVPTTTNFTDIGQRAGSTAEKPIHESIEKQTGKFQKRSTARQKKTKAPDPNQKGLFDDL